MALAVEVDPTVVSSFAFLLLVFEWFTALVAFSTVAAAPHSNEGPLQFVIFTGVCVWLVSAYIALIYVFTQREENKAGILNLPLETWMKAEFLYFALFSFFSFVSFICAAAHTHGNSNIKAGAAFMFFNMLAMIGSAIMSNEEIKQQQANEANSTYIGVNPSA